MGGNSASEEEHALPSGKPPDPEVVVFLLSLLDKTQNFADPRSTMADEQASPAPLPYLCPTSHSVLQRKQNESQHMNGESLVSVNFKNKGGLERHCLEADCPCVSTGSEFKSQHLCEKIRGVMAGAPEPQCCGAGERRSK